MNVRLASLLDDKKTVLATTSVAATTEVTAGSACVRVIVVYKVMTVTMVPNDRNGLLINGGLIDVTWYVMDRRRILVHPNHHELVII